MSSDDDIIAAAREGFLAEAQDMLRQRREMLRVEWRDAGLALVEAVDAPYGGALFQAIATALGPLPIIAEDLGLVTPDVVALLQASGFPRMKIVQFAFGDDGSHEFLPHNYEPHVVVYTGTHDNDTTLGWWASASEPQHTERDGGGDGGARCAGGRGDRRVRDGAGRHHSGGRRCGEA